ncbi:MAG TPA: histidinol dehydrogenase, partial [Candidatus Sulfotelmatobacter sp.]|nr:histidinol dehydrogenase [Candidatus Sulfotelmatobacter sp.]
MRILSGQNAARMVQRLTSRATTLTALEPRVRAIINNVRRNGDRVLRRYAEQWDGLAKSQPLQVPHDEMAAAWKTLTPGTRKSLREAAQNIRRFCEWQTPRSWTRTRRGVSLGQL